MCRINLKTKLTNTTPSRFPHPPCQNTVPYHIRITLIDQLPHWVASGKFTWQCKIRKKMMTKLGKFWSCLNFTWFQGIETCRHIFCYSHMVCWKILHLFFLYSSLNFPATHVWYSNYSSMKFCMGSAQGMDQEVSDDFSVEVLNKT